MTGNAAPHVPHAVHFRRPSRLEGGQGGVPDRLPAPSRRRDHLPGRRHRRRLAAAADLALAADRTMTSSRSCCARRARARASPTSPATTTSSCGISRARISAASSLPTGPSTRRPTARASWSSMATSSTPSSTMYAGWPISATAPTTSPSSSTGSSPRSRRLLGLPYWSFSSWAKVKVKKAVNFIGHFQEVRGRGGAPLQSTASSAAISTMPRSSGSRASTTSTPATGSRAARRSPSISTARWRSSTGPRCSSPCRADVSRCRCGKAGAGRRSGLSADQPVS